MATIDITPDKSLIQKLGLTGYKTVEAVSELLDNSIDARIPDRVEAIRVSLNFSENTITVSDDGTGMDLEDLKKGLTIAKGTKSQKTALGKFGIGMKSACSALGRVFTITTSKPDSDLEYMAHYDESEWLNNSSKAWDNFEVQSKKKTKPWHGTVVEISSLNVPIYANQTSTFIKNFGIRYGRYLKEEQITLHINRKECISIEPVVQNKSRKELKIQTDNNVIIGWIGLLERRSVGGDYGIHLFKNNRLIKAYDKFGIQNHPEVAKVMGEMHLDHVPVNFQKTDFITNSAEYIEAEEAFRSDPDVVATMHDSRSKSDPGLSIQSVIDGIIYDRPIGKLKSRMNKSRSKILLNNKDVFYMHYKSHKFPIQLEDMDDDKLYKIQPNVNGFTIAINRNSPVFEMAGNPLFLIGMIILEARMAFDAPGKYDDFLMARNANWNKFVRDWSNGTKRSNLRSSRVALPHKYFLSEDIAEVHDFLKAKSEFNFQFTGLCTLKRFLQHAYNKSIYVIKTTKDTGEPLCDFLERSYNDRFLILLNPNEIDFKKAIKYSEKAEVIVVREFTSVQKKTIASPTHAWMDLFSEMRGKTLFVYDDELYNILEHLLLDGLTSREKLETVARHKNVLPLVEKYLEAVG